MKLVPGTGSPPMPTQVVWPDALLGQLVQGLVGERARAGHDARPGRPGSAMSPGMIPMLHLPGEMSRGSWGRAGGAGVVAPQTL